MKNEREGKGLESAQYTEDMTSEPGDHTPPVRRWLPLAALLLAAALFGGGYLLGRAPLAQTQAEGTQLQARLAEAQTLARLQSARAHLYQSAVDLDRRNFGIANTNVRAAGAALAQVTVAQPSGASAQLLTRLRADLAGLNLNVAVNLREQRTRVLDLAERATRLVEAFGNPQ